MIKRQRFISRIDLKSNRDTFYVFGDNMLFKGYGGQAREMRGEPNAIGIPTKWRPDLRPDAFFRDRDFTDRGVKIAIDLAFGRITEALRAGKTVVFPAQGVGTGFARLPEHAPTIHEYIERKTRALEEKYLTHTPEGVDSDH